MKRIFHESTRVKGDLELQDISIVTSSADGYGKFFVSSSLPYFIDSSSESYLLVSTASLLSVESASHLIGFDIDNVAYTTSSNTFTADQYISGSLNIYSGSVYINNTQSGMTSTDGAGNTYVTNTTDDFNIGGVDKDTSPFWFDVSTGKFKINPVSGSSASGLVITANTITANAAFNLKDLPLSVDLETGKAFQFLVLGESLARGMFYSDGAYFMGPGGASIRDIGFYRLSTNTMRIASDKESGSAHLDITGNLTVSGSSLFLSASYDQDYSLTYTDRSLVDKGYVDSISGSMTVESASHLIGFDLENVAYTNVENLFTENQNISGSVTIYSGSLEIEDNFLLDNDNVLIGQTTSSAIIGGSNNIAIGALALRDGTTVQKNIAIGRSALRNTLTAQKMVVLGHLVVPNLISGSTTVVIGHQGAKALLYSDSNTFVGNNVALLTTLASSSVALGHFALGRNTTNLFNVGIGRSSAEYATAQYSMYLGSFAGYTNTRDYSLFIGNQTASSDPLIYGEFDTKTLVFYGTASYNQDYSSVYNDRTLVDKGWIDSITGSLYSAGSGLGLDGNTFRLAQSSDGEANTDSFDIDISGSISSFISTHDTNWDIWSGYQMNMRTVSLWAEDYINGHAVFSGLSAQSTQANWSAKVYVPNLFTYKEIKISDTTGMVITDTVDSIGIKYAGNYSASWIDRSIVDKGWIDSITGSLGSSYTFNEGITEAANVVSLGGIFSSNITFEATTSAGIILDLHDDDYNIYGDNKFSREQFKWQQYDDNTSLSHALLLQNTSVGSSFSATIISRSLNMQITMNSLTGFVIVDEIFNKGIVYANNYSASWTDRSLVDKGWIDSITGSLLYAVTSSYVTDPYIAYENEENTFTEKQTINNELNVTGRVKVINSLTKFNVVERGVAINKESASAALDIFGDLKISGSIILQATSSDSVAGAIIYTGSDGWFLGVE